MYSKSFVRKLCDTISSNKPLSDQQLYFLVGIVADYMYEFDRDCYNDFCNATLSLFDRCAYNKGGE